MVTEGKKGYYEVKVHGEYFAMVGEKKELRGYETMFKLPEVGCAMGVIQSKLLVPYLRKKDPQATTFYTCHVDDVTPVNLDCHPDDIPVRLQSREQLRKYCKLHRLSIDVDEYGSIGTLREHVRIAEEEPENLAKVIEKYRAKNSAERELMELNEDSFTRGVVNKPVSIAEGGATKNKKTKSAEEILD